ncbi:integral membrane protein [Fusarium mexicanum]|uniref:Integral membrane protein n=1 Tax=Fusarium mexicanum TaxID=751941 RepID=A0A8H5J4S5_9HYPO|nr:integral membrane protein [Fusarium mexicanum]
MSQNSSVPSTPSSDATPGEPIAAIDPSASINGPKQHVNKRHSWHVAKKATILVIARLNLRLRIQKRKLLLSDIFMVAAWISGVITAAFSPAFAVLHAFDPSVHTTLEGYQGGSANLVLILKLLFASSFPFYTTLYLCKAALLAVYLQVFPEFMVKRRRFLWATIWFVGVSYVITVVILFCICLPISRSWDLRPSKTCPKWTYAVTFHVGWGLSFLGDLLGELVFKLIERYLIGSVFIIPWLIVPALHVRRTLRLGIYFTFLLGTVNMAVSLVRFVMIWKAGADSMLWSALDVNIGLVVACLPSLRPYFGSRTKSQEQSRESNSWDSTKKHSGFGNRTICFHSKKRDSEAWPSSSGSRARYSSIDQTVVGSWDDTNGFKDANDVELRVLPGARTREVKYGR